MKKRLRRRRRRGIRRIRIRRDGGEKEEEKKEEEEERYLLLNESFVENKCINFVYYFATQSFRRSRWPSGLKRGSTAARLADCGFESRRGMISLLCFRVEVAATGRSLLQRSPTECGVSECDREASIMRRPSPTRD